MGQEGTWGRRFRGTQSGRGAVDTAPHGQGRAAGGVITFVALPALRHGQCFPQAGAGSARSTPGRVGYLSSATGCGLRRRHCVHLYPGDRKPHAHWLCALARSLLGRADWWKVRRSRPMGERQAKRGAGPSECGLERPRSGPIIASKTHAYNLRVFEGQSRRIP